MSTFKNQFIIDVQNAIINPKDSLEFLSGLDDDERILLGRVLGNAICSLVTYENLYTPVSDLAPCIKAYIHSLLKESSTFIKSILQRCKLNRYQNITHYLTSYSAQWNKCIEYYVTKYQETLYHNLELLYPEIENIFLKIKLNNHQLFTLEHHNWLTVVGFLQSQPAFIDLHETFDISHSNCIDFAQQVYLFMLQQ